ncbi:MAG: hypothetical protein LAT52_10995 [Balneolales bacterium]|nr:hypothetical protein [Balneolales bacterium]
MSTTFPISVGLDFGTYQTKACVRFKRAANLPAEYHFVPFEKQTNGMDAYFLPSVISETKDDHFVYGQILTDARFTYSFFKIASAEDEEFRLDANVTEPKYDPKRFKPYTPEFLAVVYLAHVIEKIKQYVNDELQPGKQKIERKGFLSRFQTQQKEDITYEWTIQMGVPTEYQQRHNAMRKRKFQQILYMAIELSEVTDKETLTTTELKREVDRIFENLLTHFNLESVREVDQDVWDALLISKRMSVFPETAAGLHFLVRTNKLTKDKYYLALDIGGGSTDVSFFKVEADNSFTYLASKSAMVASNDIGLRMYGSNMRLTELRDKLIASLSKPGIARNKEYQSAFKWVQQSINRQVYRMFNSQVYFRFENLKATTIYKDTSCYIYGGGALMPITDPNPERYMQRILIHDNGVRDSFTNEETHVDVLPIRELQITENVQPDSWQEKMDFLIVPLGLSLALSDDITTRLNEDFYNKDSLHTPTGLFDVSKARWV